MGDAMVAAVLALLFPGQGSQRPGMGAPWSDHPAWSVVQVVSEAAGRDVGQLLVDADAEQLRATRNAQLATFALSLVILEAVHACETPETPAAVAGHSLGEYSALVAAGALSIEEGARLVAERGEAMQAAGEENPGTMAAVLGLDLEAVASACEQVKGAWPANDNAPGQVVIAGTHQGVTAAGEAARQRGARRVVPLEVSGAFHTPLMAPARPRLEDALAVARFEPAALDVFANVDAAAHREGWPALLGAQLVSPVRWRESLLALAAAGATHFLELGPGAEMSGMVKRTVEGAFRYGVATPGDLAGLSPWLSGP